MGYGSKDVYYDPEHFGLTIVGEIEVEPDYSFDKFVVWQHADGRVFYASDSGCSCPSPFEDYTDLSDLTPVTDATFNEFTSAVNDFGWKNEPSAADKVDLISKVSRLVPRAALTPDPED